MLDISVLAIAHFSEHRRRMTGDCKLSYDEFLDGYRPGRIARGLVWAINNLPLMNVKPYGQSQKQVGAADQRAPEARERLSRPSRCHPPREPTVLRDRSDSAGQCRVAA